MTRENSKNRSVPKEIENVFSVLKRIDSTHSSKGFEILHDKIEQMILADPDEFVRIIQQGMSLHQWVYSAIANIAGDLLESGEYHVYRGVLNPVGPGEDLLNLFDTAIDELVNRGTIDAAKAHKQKTELRENIKEVG